VIEATSIGDRLRAKLQVRQERATAMLIRNHPCEAMGLPWGSLWLVAAVVMVKGRPISFVSPRSLKKGLAIWERIKEECCTLNGSAAHDWNS
jgi:hypothetical protein